MGQPPSFLCPPCPGWCHLLRSPHPREACLRVGKWSSPSLAPHSGVLRKGDTFRGSVPFHECVPLIPNAAQVQTRRSLRVKRGTLQGYAPENEDSWAHGCPQLRRHCPLQLGKIRNSHLQPTLHQQNPQATQCPFSK